MVPYTGMSNSQTLQAVASSAVFALAFQVIASVIHDEVVKIRYDRKQRKIENVRAEIRAELDELERLNAAARASGQIGRQVARPQRLATGDGRPAGDGGGPALRLGRCAASTQARRPTPHTVPRSDARCAILSPPDTQPHKGERHAVRNDRPAVRCHPEGLRAQRRASRHRPAGDPPGLLLADDHRHRPRRRADAVRPGHPRAAPRGDPHHQPAEGRHQALDPHAGIEGDRRGSVERGAAHPPRGLAALPARAGAGDRRLPEDRPRLHGRRRQPELPVGDAHRDRGAHGQRALQRRARIGRAADARGDAGRSSSRAAS